MIVLTRIHRLTRLMEDWDHKGVARGQKVELPTSRHSRTYQRNSLSSYNSFLMGFCRRCGNICSGDRCKCGGTAVGEILQSSGTKLGS